MLISDIKRVVEQVSRDKGIDRNVLIRALEEALRSAAKKKFGNKADIEVQYNEGTGEIEVFQFKEVVETITEPDLQITLEEGHQLDSECEAGDSLGVKMDTTTFGRIAAQSAKQVIIQKMKDAERDAVFSSFIDRKGEITNGIVQRIERGNIIVNLGQTEGVLPVRDQVPREAYRRGDRIRAYILDVLHDTRGPQIILSRTDANFLVNLFKTEVPEITEGIVSIMGASREPGSRSKISVSTNDPDIDPVGACVGMKGSRVQNVVQELRGEKIDIIPWHVDPAKYVCNALAPAEISRVIIDEESRSMEVIVPDEFLSVAIGKRGQNVRLASKLSGWHLDVKSESKYSQAMQDGYDSLVQLQGVGLSLADALYESGFFSAEEVSNAAPEDLAQIRDIDEEKALELIEAAGDALAELKLKAAQAQIAPETQEPVPDDDGSINAESAQEIDSVDKTTGDQAFEEASATEEPVPDEGDTDDGNVNAESAQEIGSVDKTTGDQAFEEVPAKDSGNISEEDGTNEPDEMQVDES